MTKDTDTATFGTVCPRLGLAARAILANGRELQHSDRQKLVELVHAFAANDTVSLAFFKQCEAIVVRLQRLPSVV